MDNNNNCDICVEKFTKTNNKIICIKCEFICCKTCFKRYITDPLHYFQCMSCHIEFDRTCLYKYLGITFIKNEFKRIREYMLYEIEKSLLPITQLILEREKEVDKLMIERGLIIDKFELIKKENIVKLNNFINLKEMKPINETIIEYNILKEATDVEEKIVDAIQDISNQIADYDKKKVKKTFIYKCSYKDCSGTLSIENNTRLNNYQCILCDNITCNLCREIIDKNESLHKCNPDVLESITFIDKTSKPCPSCNSYIHKIEGCFEKNTIIPTFDGMNKFIHEIKIGDTLIGDDYLPRKVLQLFTGTDSLYKVEQEFGQSYIVNSKHNLVLMKKNNTKQYIIDISTYLKLDDKIKNEFYGFKIINNEKIFSKLFISFYKIDTYYGFLLNDNNKFLYTDNTVLSNCSQMFCVKCNVAFDWNTLKITNGIIHNPHYFEYMRNNQNMDRNPLDIQCGRELNHEIIMDIQYLMPKVIINSKKSKEEKDILKNKKKFIESIMEKVLHISNVSIPNSQINNLYNRNEYLRLELLRNNITVEQFKSLIQRTDKALQKKNNILNILVMFRDTSIDITFRVYDKLKKNECNTDDIDNYFIEYETLYNYVNECINNIHRTYGNYSNKRTILDF